MDGVDYAHKECFEWTSMIRLPDFVTREVFDWAVQEATAKKKKDFSKVQFFHYDEGLCVQCMHVGSYDAEPETLEQMDAFAREQVMRQILQAPPPPRNLPQRSAPDSTGKIENSTAASCSCKIKSGKFTKTVDFRCEMCYN